MELRKIVILISVVAETVQQQYFAQIVSRFSLIIIFTRWLKKVHP
jgi:hypothetical protein